jgi:hypothetical protein
MHVRSWKAGWLPKTWHWNAHEMGPPPFAMQTVKQATAIWQLGLEAQLRNWLQHFWARQSPQVEPSLGQAGGPHTPFEHWPEQHSPGLPHIAPLGWQTGGPHTPFEHWPEQHSPGLMQAFPSGWQGGPQTPLLHAPLQHSPADEHIPPFGVQGFEQTPPLHTPLQHSRPEPHPTPFGLQGVPQMPPRHAPLQHSRFPTHTLPSGLHGGEQMLLKQMPLQHSDGFMQPPPSAVHLPQSMPQMLVASLTQMSSQLAMQQMGSTLQICCWQGPQAGSSGGPTSQTVWGHSMPPHTPPAQMPAQHSPEKLHEAPFGRQPPQTSPTHAPEQHSPENAHFWPWGRQSTQTPPAHDPLQHWKPTWHENPVGWHCPPVHFPRKQPAEQHWSLEVQSVPSGKQPSAQTPPRQRPEQQVNPSKQGLPEGKHPPQMPPRHGEVQHSPSKLQPPPSGTHSSKPHTKPERQSPKQHG